MLKTNFNPNQEHISTTKNWLNEEWNESKEGFITNWNMISKAYDEKRISILTKSESAIGFVVYCISDEVATIDIAEIKPAERKKGIARKFILETLEFFKSNGVIVVKLFCDPEISEGFWNKCGFEEFDIPYNDKVNMYKVLVSDLKPCRKTQANDVLKLWACEPHQIDRNARKLIWNLEYKSDNRTLIKPIVFPAFKDWQLELEKDGMKIKSKVKKFPIDLFYNGTFMIIHEISC